MSTTHKFKIQGIDCANCAREMQDRAAKVDGVENVSINFLTERVRLTLSDGADLDETVDAIEDACNSVDEGVEIVR